MHFQYSDVDMYAYSFLDHREFFFLSNIRKKINAKKKLAKLCRKKDMMNLMHVIFFGV
jgi:hypothetical protein